MNTFHCKNLDKTHKFHLEMAISDSRLEFLWRLVGLTSKTTSDYECPSICTNTKHWHVTITTPSIRARDKLFNNQLLGCRL